MGERNKAGLIIGILLLIIVILIGFLVYAFIIGPKLSGYVINAQNQGYAFAISSIMQQAATCQTVPLTFGNQTINLIAVECLQQPQQSQQPQE